MNLNFATMLKNQKATVKWLSLLAGVAVLTLSSRMIPAALAQSSSTAATPSEGRSFHRQNWLNLTSEQQAQMEQIKQSEREQIGNVLTDAQKTQLEAARANRGERGQMFESLNLTDEQQTQIQQIREATRQQMDTILTAEQRQQLQQHRPPVMDGTQPPQ
jgi:Spy/CpxP family protein refolding chaperone